MRLHPLTLLLLIAAVAGFIFASVSTYDFVAHLDRQVHGIHCSFLLGLGPTETANTGCHVTLMSPYSSVWRGSIWGGLPISLPAMSVFAFIAFWALWIGARGRDRDPSTAAFTLAAVALPAVASLFMAYISLTQLHAVCKLCMGIYVSSATALVCGVVLFLRARGQRTSFSSSASSPAVLAGAFGLGVLFVAVPVTTYAISAPDFSRFIGSCGELAHPDGGQALIALGPQGRQTSMVEMLDPLCPSCRGFEARFSAMPVHEQISRQVLLFPLDNTCNWMIGDSIHPGACSISEAMLCAKDRADQVLAWSFENQEAIVEATRADPKAAARMVGEKFPELASCVGSSAARAKLNLALRFAVKNHLQVLTPQVFVNGLRLCDEDTDLGLDFALPRLIERAQGRGHSS
jgi:uncharacterized membrane protein